MSNIVPFARPVPVEPIQTAAEFQTIAVGAMHAMIAEFGAKRDEIVALVSLSGRLREQGKVALSNEAVTEARTILFDAQARLQASVLALRAATPSQFRHAVDETFAELLFIFSH